MLEPCTLIQPHATAIVATLVQALVSADPISYSVTVYQKRHPRICGVGYDGNGLLKSHPRL